MGSEDESEGRLSCHFCFSYLLLLPLGSDDGYRFADYDEDDGMQGNTSSGQVDIDPYAGVPTRRCCIGAC